ncbi:DsrE family protein [Pontibaca salina]|uniref:DsrE family protein n=1 Tax=Pontibaca salina TaxID=2795731 RepID=A0A934HKY8_9RHOB|nr:DsrE family protein [Pontibaca salina]MBI6630018.1 DsrE family protein [Pontibaca salina]
MKFSARLPALAAAFLVAQSLASFADEGMTPYGTAKVDMHEYPEINQVFDVNYEDPNGLVTLAAFVKNTRKVVPGKTVVVSHGPELRAFAKQNYDKYYGLMDMMAELADQGVEFRMCSNAVRAAGYKPEDMHGFVTVVPAGFAEVVLLQSEGYEYINPIPLPVGGLRELEEAN